MKKEWPNCASTHQWLQVRITFTHSKLALCSGRMATSEFQLDAEVILSPFLTTNKPDLDLCTTRGKKKLGVKLEFIYPLVLNKPKPSFDKKRNTIPTSIVDVEYTCDKSRSKTIWIYAWFLCVAWNSIFAIVWDTWLVLPKDNIVQCHLPHWPQHLYLEQTSHRNTLV